MATERHAGSLRLAAHGAGATAEGQAYVTGRIVLRTIPVVAVSAAKV